MPTDHASNVALRKSSAEDHEGYEMEDSLVLSKRAAGESTVLHQTGGKRKGVARYTIGLILLLSVVFLWTSSNFLGSSIFADNTYAKPFFLTYLNTSCFVICLVPGIWRAAREEHKQGTFRQTVHSTFTKRGAQELWAKSKVTDDGAGTENEEEQESFLSPTVRPDNPKDKAELLPAISTARLALAFCILWFLANYFAMACLQYTTVASTTILTSTSSMWTLLIGALTRTEKFTWRKLCGVIGSLIGIVLISQVDLGAQDSTDADDGSTFPSKPPFELALGDALALLSAVIYGVYTIVLKRTTLLALPKEIHMPTFFGFVGLFNVFLLWPLFLALHFTNLESFELPPTGHVWTVLLVNSVSSVLSDICWAYAMVFTSPLVVTVGLSLTIPLSLVGEMIIQGRFESWVYWIGAFVVVGSFVFVEKAGRREDEDGGKQRDEENIGEPGPAIVIEDYDEQARRRESTERSLLIERDVDSSGIHRSSEAR